MKALTANIKESIDKSVPVRSTKMAYVDNFVKPPRNVLRNQAKYGTAKSSTSSSDLKKKLILSGSGNSATNIAVPPPPMSRMKTSCEYFSLTCYSMELRFATWECNEKYLFLLMICSLYKIV